MRTPSGLAALLALAAAAHSQGDLVTASARKNKLTVYFVAAQGLRADCANQMWLEAEAGGASDIANETGGRSFLTGSPGRLLGLLPPWHPAIRRQARRAPGPRLRAAGKPEILPYVEFEPGTWQARVVVADTQSGGVGPALRTFEGPAVGRFNVDPI